MLRPIAATVIALAFFRGLQPAAELCALAIRRRWPDAWFSSSIVADADFLALVFDYRNRGCSRTVRIQTILKLKEHLILNLN
jgi:hypothetical protein